MASARRSSRSLKIQFAYETGYVARPARRHWGTRSGRANNTANAALLGEGLAKATQFSDSSISRGAPSSPVSLVVAVIAWVSLAAWQALAIAGGDVTPVMCHGALSRGDVLQVVEDAKLGLYEYSGACAWWFSRSTGVARDVLATYGDADIEGDARLFARQRVVASVSFCKQFLSIVFSIRLKGALCACEINAGHSSLMARARSGFVASVVPFRPRRV